MSTERSRWIALIAALLTAFTADASAQRDERQVPELTCAPAWWDHAAVIAALRVELREFGIDVGTDGDPISIEPLDCADPDGSFRVELTTRDGLRAREVPVHDIAPELRPRALALSVASLLRELLESDPVEDVPVEEPSVEPPTPPLPDEVCTSNCPLHRTPAALVVEADTYVLQTVNLFVGLRVAIALRPLADARFFFIDVGGSLRATQVGDPFGDVQALWAEGAVGLGADVDLGSAAALFARLGVGLGWAGARGSPTPDSTGGVGDGAVVSIELDLGAEIALAPGVALRLGLGGCALPYGLDVLAGTRVKLAIREIAMTGRIGIAVDF